jgi:type I restriction enzyme, S subunit
VTGSPSNWRRLRAKHIYREVDERSHTDAEPLLAVSIHRGVVPRTALTDDEPKAFDLRHYKRCHSGDIVLNRMRAFQGAVGVAPYAGIVSPDYAVLRISAGFDQRFVHYLFRSSWFVAEMTARLRGIGSSSQGNVRTPRINVDDLGEIALRLPHRDIQREIGGYLDDEVQRLNALAEAKYRLSDLLDERRAAWITEALHDLGAPSFPLGYRYDVQLGKMLDQTVMSGIGSAPYLRNANVQWDRLDLDDLREMDFSDEDRQKYALTSGDLLVCEGGDVGRAAQWSGQLDRCFYQKALHRVRPRFDDEPRFLMYCLRAAASYGTFLADGNQSTIPHLTAEKLRAHRFPFPAPSEQRRIVATLDTAFANLDALAGLLDRQLALLAEHREALITAAVTGQIDVTREAPTLPEEALEPA